MQNETTSTESSTDGAVAVQPVVMPHYSQGVCEDGAVILCDGERMTVDEIVAALNTNEQIENESDSIQLGKMNKLIYSLTKDAARSSFVDYLHDLGIDANEYRDIKLEFKKIGVDGFYL